MWIFGWHCFYMFIMKEDFSLLQMFNILIIINKKRDAKCQTMYVGVVVVLVWKCSSADHTQYI